jgi:acetyl esterase/lipase
LPGGHGSLTIAAVTDLREYRYGPAPAQVCELHLPDGTPTAVAVLVHGGFWRARYDRSQEHAIAADLVARGWTVWNVDYRGVGEGTSSGGGWPRTFEDVAAAVDLLASVPGVPRHRVAVVGHSAGGQLALWIAGRHRLPGGAPGAAPKIRPVAAVAQAGVVDLVAAAREGVGNGAVVDVLGATPDADPARYALTSPVALVPLGVPVLVVTGDEDESVPWQLSASWAAAARAAGDDVTLHVEPGEGHMGHVDPASRVWAVARAFLSERVLDERMRA